MVSSKDTMEGGNREYHTHSGIYVAFHLRFAAKKEWQVFISFPIRFFLNWSIEMKGRVAVTQSSNAAGKTKDKTRSANQIQKQCDKGYKRIYKFNTSSIKAEQQQQKDIAACEATLEHLGIKQQFGYADHATIYNFAERVEDAPIHTIDASVPPAPITENPEYNEHPKCSPPAQFNTEVVVSTRHRDRLHLVDSTAAVAAARARRAKAIWEANRAK